MFELVDGRLNYTANLLSWIDFGVTLVVILAIGYVVFKVLTRTFVRIFASCNALILVLAWVFNLKLLWSFSLAVLVVAGVIFYMINVGEVRTSIANRFSSKPRLANGGKNHDEKLFDRVALYDRIEATVATLSKTKTGALITFEKGEELTDIAKSGTIINAPVVPELLTTIFYPGTRLHDGAVIIRKNLIYAAAVYYTPTTKPLTGKFGSRHRAAIGISEISDAVTIVVSEETGRISLAIGGDLIHVGLDNFRRVFEDYMNASSLEAGTK